MLNKQSRSLIKTGTPLMDTGLDKGAGADIREGFCLRLDAEIIAHPKNNSPQVFSIPYKMSDGCRALRPDFIFFTRDAEGVVRPAIIDPHGVFLEDTLPKLKGYVDYLRDYPDEFAQVLVLSEVADGDTRFLDLLDAATQNAIMNFMGDHVEELYTGEFSRYYGRREQ